MSQSLADLMPAAADFPVGMRLWLKSSAYTRRLLMGETGDPWLSASQYLSYFSQAHGLLKPDVAVLEVGELFDSWLQRDPALRVEMAGKRKLSFPLRKWLEQPQPRDFLAEVVMALLGHLRAQTPLVLAMPSPRKWLKHANLAAGRDAMQPNPGDVEDAAMYVADLIRAVSMYEIGGLLLEEDAVDEEPADIELYRPLINVAKHYRWPLAIRQGGSGVAANSAVSDIDVFIGARGQNVAGLAQGVDVGVKLWAGEALPALRPQQFYFAEIPTDQRPEHVLDCLNRLRG